MAKTKNEKYIAEQYVRYFGKTPTDAQITEYAKFGKAKLILNEIRIEAGLKNANMSKDEQIHDLFNNLFGRSALDSELTKYKVKYLDKGKALPINSIIKAAKKGSTDKAVWDTKKAVALFIAEKGSTTNIDLDKITKDTYKEIFDGKKLTIATVAQLEAKVDAMKDNVPGQTFNLTTRVDAGKDFIGTEKGDLFTAHYDAQANVPVHTLSALDELDGAAGKDTLKITSDNGATAYTMAAATIKNIEAITIQGSAAVTANVAGSNITGLETISVLKSTTAAVHANSTTDVNVSGATGTIDVSGGKNIVVNDATANQTIKIGSSSTVTGVTTTNATGTITVTDTDNSAANAITVNGGTDVTVTATATASTTGAIAIGGAKAATGDVKVTQNNNFDGATAGMTNTGAITVTGGKTVDVTVNNTITAKDASANGNINNLGQTITVNSDGKTTDVTVKQTETVAEFVTPETALVNGKTAITFKAMTAGQALSIDGLSFHATKNLTASEVAAAFANLTDSDTQADGGKTANGYYTGALATAGLTTGAANGAVVEFISVNQTPVTFTVGAAQTAPAAKLIYGYNTGTIGTIVTTMQPTAGTQTTGTAFAAETPTGNNVLNGKVVIEDDATASIKTITVDGYGVASTIGSSKSVDALTDLTLKNGSATMAVTTGVASLNLTVDDVQSAVTLTAANLKTLNLTTTGEEESAFGLVAAAVETLTIAAGADLDIATGSNLTALKTAIITGAGDVDLGDLSGSTIFATLTASAATGDISASVNASIATVTTGAGDDSITVKVATEVTKAIDLGAGNDRLDLSTITTVNATTTAAIAGGAGTDTVVLNANLADVTSGLSSLANSAIFKSKVTGFEKLEIAGAITAARDVNVGNLGYNHVILGANTTALTLSDMANNGTVVLTANQAGGATVAVKDAATGLTDVLNVVVNTEDALTTGTLVVANVETINISTVDLDADELSDGAVTLDLNAAAAKTVNVSGNADLTLDMTGNSAATLIDASTMTGNLKVTAFNSGMTVKGGAGDDTLSVSGSPVAAILTGGKGTDTFDVSAFNSLGNAGSAVTITDLTAGETIVFKVGGTGVEQFVSGKVTLIAESTFTEYVAKAAEIADNAGTDSIAWFQFNQNTFVVQDLDNSGTFSTGDIIVKINGVKDLSTASFNATDGTLEIA